MSLGPIPMEGGFHRFVTTTFHAGHSQQLKLLQHKNKVAIWRL